MPQPGGRAADLLGLHRGYTNEGSTPCRHEASERFHFLQHGSLPADMPSTTTALLKRILADHDSLRSCVLDSDHPRSFLRIKKTPRTEGL